MRQLRLPKKQLPDWEEESEKAAVLLEQDCFQEAIDHYIVAIEYVQEFFYNMLYSRIVNICSQYILTRSDGKTSLDIEPLEKLAIETDRYSLYIYEPHLNFVHVILDNIDKYDEIYRKMNLFNTSNRLTKQFFGITTSLGSYYEMCGYMLGLCDKLSEISDEEHLAVEAYRMLYQSIQSKIDEIIDDPDKALEYFDEWRFTEKERTYLRYIDELYEITNGFITEKRSDTATLNEEYGTVLNQFKTDFLSILDGEQ